MSYTIYTTPAYILEIYETGEHDRTLLLLTRDHGMMYVRATGVRKATSKMRMHIKLWSHVSVSLVQGKLWRLTGIETLANYPFISFDHMTGIMKKLVDTIKKLHSGEYHGSHEYELMVRLLESVRSVRIENKATFELWGMMHILATFGYWDESTFSTKNNFDSTTSFFLEGMRHSLLPAINHALSATQLVYTTDREVY